MPPIMTLSSPSLDIIPHCIWPHRWHHQQSRNVLSNSLIGVSKLRFIQCASWLVYCLWMTLSMTSSTYLHPYFLSTMTPSIITVMWILSAVTSSSPPFPSRARYSPHWVHSNCGSLTMAMLATQMISNCIWRHRWRHCRLQFVYCALWLVHCSRWSQPIGRRMQWHCSGEH